MDTAFVLFCKHPGCPSIAENFLKRKFAEATDEEIGGKITVLERRYLESNQDDLIDILNGGGPVYAHAHSVAGKFSLEWRCDHWASQMNENQGVAPSQKSLWHFSERANLEMVTDESPPRATRQGIRAQLAWCQRFRRRWSQKLANIHAGDILPRDVARYKVMPSPETRSTEGRFNVCFRK